MNIIILGFWGGFFWSCFRVVAAIAIGVAVGVAVAAIASVAGLTPLAGVALGIGAGIAAGAIAYSLIGPYPEQTPPSTPSSQPDPIVKIEKPPIETVTKEVVVPIRFKAPDDGSSPTIHFYCEIKDDNNWKPIQGASQKDMLDKISSRFKEIEQQRASDQKVVDNKQTETFFTINVYKRPFPGDTILSELKKLSLERFNTPKDTYNIYDLEYSESESEGDN